MSNGESAAELNELFPEVVREPVFPPPATDSDRDEYYRREMRLESWLDQLRRHFPLWSFQRWNYYRRQDTELPSTHPLQMIIDSILDDEGLDPRTAPSLPPLRAELDRRRRHLMYDGSTRINRWSDAGEREQVELDSGTVRFEDAPELFDEPHPEEEGFRQHEALHVGYRICHLTEQRLRARYRGDEERANEIHAEIEDYLREVGALRSPGNPSGRPSNDCIVELVNEGRELIDLFWDALPIRFSSEFTSLLQRQDVPESERQLWGLALTLPVFSTSEVGVILEQREEYESAPERPGHPTPRRLAVYAVAHRLNEDASGIDRIHAGGGGGEGFRYGPNPFQRDSG